MIYIANTKAWIGIVASFRETVWTPRGAFDGGYFMINLWYQLGCLVDQGGVAN
jgi:hypothetical protein